jgi:MFS family permease
MYSEDMPNEGVNRGLFHPSGKYFRFMVLAFVSMLTLGCYFAYDIIGGIADSLMKSVGASESQIGTMYTMYSIAAIVAVFISGFLIDRLGTRKGSMIFSSLVLAGAVIVAFGSIAKSLPLLYAGRFVFGAGSEPLVVVQSAMLSRWFKGKELALSFGISLTVSRIGTLFAFNTGEVISTHFGGPHYALIAGALTCLLSLFANVVYVFLDRKGEKALQLQDGSGDKVVLKDIAFFKPTFWYVTMLCVTFYSAIFPFTSLALKFFNEKWGIPEVSASTGTFMYKVFSNFIHMFSTAGGITSIVIFASMVLAPFAGKLVDKVGKRATFMIYGSLLMIPSHLVMGITNMYPVIPMMALGAAFVLVPAAMWPSVPLIVSKERVGTAFGTMTAVQNIGLALFPYLNGKLREWTGTYTASQVMFACLGLVGLFFAIMLIRANKKENNVLEKP